MTTTLLNAARPEAAPTESEATLAREAGVMLKRVVGKHPLLRLRLELEGSEPDGEEFVLPEVATRLLLHILDETANGNAVALVPLHAELTTQQAADTLNVSRPHLVKLIENGELPSRKVGTHRRVRMDDLMAYRDRAEAQRRQALADLAAETRMLGLDD